MSDLTELNKQFFDTIAGSYKESPRVTKLHEDLAKEVRAHLDWLGIDWVDPEKEEGSSKTVRVFDYACGPGHMSKIFLPFATSVVGADLSTGMVEQYNRVANEQGLEPMEMKAVQGDLLSTPPSTSLDGSEFHDFDLALCSLAFHHFNDFTLAASRLVERVKKGTGKVLVIEFVPGGAEDHGGHGAGHTGHGNHGHTHSNTHVLGEQEALDAALKASLLKDLDANDEMGAALRTCKHLGISPEQMKVAFEAAGCHGIKTEILGAGHTWVSQEKKIFRTVYMTVATRAA
ncbi:MAG: hypothetical protein M1814_001373 [Vezdaea aestivalis]|nr:MAG: hypothetical protein M1814_001373 [Vezdaea aestivalis]